MLHCGHSREALIQQGTAHTRRGVQSCRTRQQGLNAKLKMGWEPPGSHPIRYVVCSRISQLCMPLNSVFRRLLSLRLSFTLSAPPISVSTPLRHIHFIRRSSRIHYSLHPSNRRLPSNFRTRPACTSTPRSSAHVRSSRAHQPRDRPPPQSSTAMARAPSNITSPARHSHRHPDPQPQSVRQLRTRSSHSPFALGLRQLCACHALPSARISQSCSRPRSPTGCEGMRSPAGCSLHFVMALRYRASPPKVASDFGESSPYPSRSSNGRRFARASAAAARTPSRTMASTSSATLLVKAS